MHWCPRRKAALAYPSDSVARSSSRPGVPVSATLSVKQWSRAPYWPARVTTRAKTALRCPVPRPATTRPWYAVKYPEQN